MDTSSELMTLGRQLGVYTVAFSPDGKRIASGGMGSVSDATIMVWESEMPAGGYEPRRTATVARKIVDELYKEHGLYSEVIDNLKTDATLNESIRTVALQIASSRQWEDEEKKQ